MLRGEEKEFIWGNMRNPFVCGEQNGRVQNWGHSTCWASVKTRPPPLLARFISCGTPASASCLVGRKWSMGQSRSALIRAFRVGRTRCVGDRVGTAFRQFGTISLRTVGVGDCSFERRHEPWHPQILLFRVNQAIFQNNLWIIIPRGGYSVAFLVKSIFRVDIYWARNCYEALAAGQVRLTVGSAGECNMFASKSWIPVIPKIPCKWGSEL